MASLILGVAGRQRSGKDTFAARLVDAHGFTRVAFADPLKATLLDVNPWVVLPPDELGIVFGSAVHEFTTTYLRLAQIVHLVGWEDAKRIREVRRLMQAHGVAIREHVDPDVWVDAALAKAEEISEPVVITDVRFPNEFDAIERTGGGVARIERPGLDATDTHVSETALDGYGLPYVIVNDGTIADLHAKADDLLRNSEIAWPLAAYR